MTKRAAARISISIDALMDNSISALKGNRLLIRLKGGPENDKFYPEHLGDPNNKLNEYLRILLGEAIYAAEAFANENGYLPRQPRFSVMLEDDGRRAAAPRRWEKIAEIEAIDAVLSAAARAADDGENPS